MICAITGCAFVTATHWVPGDLYQTKDGSWFFQANITVTRGMIIPSWQPGKSVYTKTFTAKNYWLRNGVFVFDSDQPVFNEAVTAYLKE